MFIFIQLDNASGDEDSSGNYPSVCSKNHDHILTKSLNQRKESVISNFALSKRRKSSRFLNTNFDTSSPGSLVNQNIYNTKLNLVQLAQLQRLQKLKLLHNTLNSTIPKMNYLLNKSNENQQFNSTDYAKENISENQFVNQVSLIKHP